MAARRAAPNGGRVLWPLLHYLPGEVVFKEGDWEDYLVASRHFSETLRRLDIRAGDMIWVHDYHLMPLPGILRQVYGPRVKIGFFLHIPFPSSEIFKVLPVCRELLLGLVHADLISFHSYDYARHFSSACAKLLGIVPTVGGFEWNGQMVHVETAPIGIDPDVFLRGLADEQVQLRVADLQRAFEGKRVILGVDRLDYIKGIPNKIAAFRRFLEQHPELRGSVVLVQVAVPSRTDVQEYVDLGTSVFEMAGNCNALYGTADSSPLQLISRSVGYHELSALYQVAEVCLVSSLRDGMNLVAYEYVASQAERHGVLILSEFAGAAQCFGGALFVNPWDLDGMARRLAEALEMPAARREALHAQLFRYTCAHTATRWGQAFVDRLARVGGHRGAGPGVEVCWGEGARADSGPGSAAASPGECECVDREGLGGWGAGVLGIFQLAAGRTPGSRLEVARGSITWSFEYGDREFWSYQAEGLRASLQATGAAEHGQLSVSESSVSLVSTGAERG